ncbi:MAG: ribonucleotide-diphosphate reductase subunit alpha, partial [Chloroflexi bacterium]|nr:ribonucleotide-diphosphate reductase subunit alpha [Chloroflexota bacterium]
MNEAKQSEKKQLSDLNRTEILRAVVADAESMGLRDKDKIEQLTSRIIERLERPQPLPGMEELVPKSSRQRKGLPTKSEIQAMVKEILASKEAEIIEKEKVKPMVKLTTQVKPDAQPEAGIALTENARQVLERRYLKKDKQG